MRDEADDSKAKTSHSACGYSRSFVRIIKSRHRCRCLYCCRDPLCVYCSDIDRTL